MNTSRPPRPAGHDPHETANWRFLEHATPCEWGESYHPGGYHPIELGDVLGDRYEVARKLGYGSYSTVWLAVDRFSKTYVALKIMVARVDEAKVRTELSLYEQVADSMRDSGIHSHFLGLENSFDLTGSNGNHTCLVFQPMGPNLSQFLRSPEFRQGGILDDEYILPKSIVKRVLREVLLGLQLLHRNGVVHGDLHLGNILVNIKVNEFEATDVSSLRQTPEEGDTLERIDGKKDLWAPSYLIPGRALQEFTSPDLDPLTTIADLGAAYSEDNSSTDTVTPAHLRSPECILSRELGPGVDVWSFGCLMYELLTGQQLFHVLALEGDKYDEENNDEHLIQIPEVLSTRLPGRFFQAWNRGSQYLDADGKRLKQDMELDSRGNAPAFGEAEGGMGDDWKPQNDHDSEVDEDLESHRDHDDEINEDFDGQSNFSDLPIELADPPPFLTLEARFKKEKPTDVDEVEEAEIVRILHRTLQIDPKQRPKVDEILQELWFLTA